MPAAFRSVKNSQKEKKWPEYDLKNKTKNPVINRRSRQFADLPISRFGENLFLAMVYGCSKLKLAKF